MRRRARRADRARRDRGLRAVDLRRDPAAPHTGTDAYDTGVDVDRLYVNGELGIAAIEVGRDMIALGPSSRTQVGWGDNAPPLDHVRISTARPLVIDGHLRGSLVYVLGRLRAPQTYPGTSSASRAVSSTSRIASSSA